ncbi:hypothetical protein ACFV2T_38015, partial [Streptomyces sp. NPDC059651]
MIIGRHRYAEPRLRHRRHLASLLLSSVLAAVAGMGPPVPARADGAGKRGLALSVSVNSRPGTGALRPGIRVGDPVVKTYLLINRGSADLYDVRVTDPGLPGVAVHCSGGDRVPMLRGLGSARCTAETKARPGTWTGDVLASGHIPYLHADSKATARSGYKGIRSALALTEGVTVTGRQAAIRYQVTNRGRHVVYDIRLSDPLVAAGGIDCGGGRPVVARLGPGRSARCRAVVRRAPGAYVSKGLAGGSDRITTLGRTGGRVPPRRLTARASGRFTLPRPPASATRPRPPARAAARAAAPPRTAPRTPPPVAGPPPAAAQPPPPTLQPVPTNAPGLPVPTSALGLPLPPPGVAAPGLLAPPEAAAAQPPGGAVPRSRSGTGRGSGSS